MRAVTILPHVEPRLTKEEIRQWHDNDLLLLIALTDATMFRRELTDNERANFWLVIDERKERASNGKNSIFRSQR